MSRPAHGAATDGQTEKLTAAMGQACRKPPAPEHRDCGVPGRAPSFQLSSDHAPESSVLQSHTTEQYSLKGIPSPATKALMQHPSESREHSQAGGSCSLSLHQLDNLALGTTSQASVSSPVEWEDWTHTSQLGLRIKEHTRMAFRAQHDLTSTNLLLLAWRVFIFFPWFSLPDLKPNRQSMTSGEVRAQASGILV